MNEVKFIQLIVAPWDGDNGRRTYSMFALGDDGRVYRQERAVGGWRPMAKRILTATQIQEMAKKKYGAKYVDRGEGND